MREFSAIHWTGNYSLGCRDTLSLYPITIFFYLASVSSSNPSLLVGLHFPGIILLVSHFTMAGETNYIITDGAKINSLPCLSCWFEAFLNIISLLSTMNICEFLNAKLFKTLECRGEFSNETWYFNVLRTTWKSNQLSLWSFHKFNFDVIIKTRKWRVYRAQPFLYPLKGYEDYYCGIFWQISGISVKQILYYGLNIFTL